MATVDHAAGGQDGLLDPRLLQLISTATVDPFALYRVEADGRLRHEWVDPRCAEGTPVDVADIEGRVLEEVFPPDVAERFRHYAERAMRTGQPVRYEAARKLPGRVVSVELTISPIVVEGTCRQLLVSLRDISDRAALERERAQSERRLRKLMANAPHVLWQMGRDGTILSVTPAVEAVTGYAAEEYVGQRGGRILDPAEVPRMQRLFATVLRSPPGEVHRAEVRFTSRSGEPRWMHCTFSNLLDDPDIGAIVVIVHDITERKRAEEQLAHQAGHDILTGLPNRRQVAGMVDDMLCGAHDADHLAAVAFVDLDNFKLVNDTLGHDVGDQLICEAAERLRTAVGDRGWVARLGGDEFIVVAAGLAPVEDHVRLARELRAALTPPFDVAGTQAYLSASVGLATASRRDDLDADALLRHADLAMYEAKRQPHGDVRRFEASLHERAQQRLEMMSSLRASIREDRLVIHNQPIIDVATSRPVALEALVRWDHPARGLLLPTTFMEVAEDTGLVIPIGDWVLDTVGAQIAAWDRAGFPPLPVAVRASPRQVLDADFVPKIRAALERRDIEAHRLIVEMHERTLGEDPERGRSVLEEIAQLGVPCTLDDFGHASAALSHLGDLPIRAVKIDHTFIGDLGSGPRGRPDPAVQRRGDPATLVGALISLAHALGLAVIAAGVERPSQLEALATLGCSYAQGHHIGIPLPPDEVLASLSRTLGASH